MKNILIFVITSFVSLNLAFCQDLLNSYSAGANAITPARIKYFDNHVYIAANITINNQTFPSIIKLDNIGNIIWQTRLDQPGTVIDLEFVSQSMVSDKSILLVGESNSTPLTLDNMSFVWKVKDDGTHIVSKFYDHTGIEGFTRIILHPNPLNSSFKYYLIGKRNVAFPATQQNPSHSFKTILYNIDENLNINWSKNIEVVSGVPSGNQAHFYNSILPNSNGNITLLGAESIISSQFIVAGSRIEVNPNNQIGNGYKSSRPREYRDGIILNGQLHIAGHLFNIQGGFLGSDISRGNGGSFGTGQKYISNLTGHNGIAGLGTDIYTINVKIGNPNGGKIMINKYQFSSNPTYSLNYINSVVITPPGITTNFGNQQISNDAAGNIIFSTSSNGILYFGEINNTLNSTTSSSCYLGTTFSPINDNDDGGGYQWRFLTETNSVTTAGQGISFNLTKTAICSPPTPCVLTVGFTHTPGNCGAVTFTPTVTGGTAPYTYTWDIGCNGIDFTTQNPTYTYTFPTSGTYDVCLTVTDASGTCIGSKTTSISVIKDNVSPVITCPIGNVQLTTNPEVCYATAGGVSATDNCDMNPSITCVLTGATTGTFTNTPQIQYNKGVTTVICTATDDSGNVSSSCTFTVTVFDSSTPQIECPDHITINALSCDNSAEATFPPPTIYDNCPMWSYTCDYMSGDLFPCGNTIVTCTVTDMGGAIESCSFSVNVVCSNNCPEVTDTILECGTVTNTYNYSVTIENPNSNVCTYTLSLPSSQGIVNTSNPITNGNITTISGNLTPANNAISAFNLSIVASCTCNGNQQQTCNLSAILNNIEALPAPPQIICPPSITINTTLDECYSFYEDVSATDNCDPNPSTTCILSGATIGVFTNVSSIQYNVGITLVECVATDIDGATDQCSFTVTVIDEQEPAIICPTSVSTQVTDCSNSAAVAFPAPVVTDNCSMVQYTCSHQRNDIFNCGNTLVTCTATDMNGNTATCDFEVIVACNCVDVLSSAIKCDETTHTYEFTINIINYAGAGSFCNSVLSLDPAQGVILNQTTVWNGTSGTITGNIDPTLVAPFTFNLSLVSDCTCVNGLSQNCTVDILYPITEVCNDLIIFDKIYGDTSNNIASGIKAFGDGIYVASKKSVNGTDYGIMSKFNRITGLLDWETSLRLDTDEFILGPINDFEYVPGDDALLVIGNKISGSIGAPPFSINQYASYVLKIDCQTGNLIFYNQYPFKGRNFFTKIIRHPNPVNGSHPYYIAGFKNPEGFVSNPTTIDRIFLLNMDKNGIINFGREFNSAVAPTFFDDEFGRGLFPLDNGNLLLLGNDGPNGDGVILQVSGANGTPVNGLLKGIGNTQTYNVLDGIQLNDTTLVIVGEKTDTEHGFISIYNYNTQNFNLSHLQSAEFGSINRFRNIHMDAYKNLYIIGQNISGAFTNDHTVVYSFNVDQTRNFRSRFSKFLHDNNELDYTEGFIDVSPEADRIYYVDSRLNTSNNFGQFDMLVGAYDLDLNNICQDTFINQTIRIIVPTSPYTVNSFALNIPTPSHSITTPPITYQCADFCGPNCNVTAAFEAISVNCFEIQFNDLSSGGTAPYTYEWDFDCTSPAESTSQNPTWTFPDSGTYTICLTVTDATGACSSSIMQVVVVPPDQNNPILNCPGDITLNTDTNQCYATYGGVSATDTCDTSINIVCILTGATSGTFTNQGQLQYNKGVTTVTCTATDDSGNTVSCSFMVTVEDNQFPTIICPQNMVVNVPFCAGGANVTFDPPSISDNCPMASFTSTHASGDFFPCGTTMVTCTVTDMFGNTNSFSFNITVNCTCTNVVSTDIQCGSSADTYDFTIMVQNLSGNGDTCNLVLTLDPTNGIVQNQQIIWNVTETEATITGTVISLLPVPSFFNFSLTSTCICPDMTQTVCTTPIILIPLCCKSAYLIDEEICKEDSTYTISVGFNGSVTSITQVNWYISFSDPCPTSVSDPTWLLYASITSNSDTVDIYPSSLTGNHFCMYAVVSVADNPCTMLITDIASYTLCDMAKCTLSSQQICYYGSPVVPAPISLTASNTSCTYNIEWLDSSGNPISSLSNQLTYQPPALTWTGHPDSCRQNFTFAAIITSLCGTDTCYSTITLVNDAAPYGNIIMDPFEQQPFCPGEDATLRFITECHVVEGMEAWKWFETSNHLNQVPSGFVTIDGMELMNPMLHTNSLQSDTWFSVKVGDGICPPKVDTFFIDVYKKATLTQFIVSPLDPCRTTGVNMTVLFSSPDCPVVIDWYKDGILINSSTHATSPASFNFQYTGVTGDYSGNYHVVLRNSCCPDQFVNSIIRIIDPPMQLVLVVPCSIKGGETVSLEAVVLDASGPCSFEWYDNSNFIGSGPLINVSSPGNYNVIATCGSCVLSSQYDLIECCPVSVIDDDFFQNFSIYPNPTTGQLTIQFISQTDHDLTLKVLDVLGRQANSGIIQKGSSNYSFSIDDMAGIYIIQITDSFGNVSQRKVIKIE